MNDLPNDLPWGFIFQKLYCLSFVWKTPFIKPNLKHSLFFCLRNVLLKLHLFFLFLMISYSRISSLGLIWFIWINIVENLQSEGVSGSCNHSENTCLQVEDLAALFHNSSLPQLRILFSFLLICSVLLYILVPFPPRWLKWNSAVSVP